MREFSRRGFFVDNKFIMCDYKIENKRGEKMIYINKENFISVLKKLNVVLFILQLYVPFVFLVYFLNYVVPYEFIKYANYIMNKNVVVFVIAMQLIFIFETIFLQYLFSESYRSKMKKICFLGTVVFLFFGYFVYVASIF